MTLPDTHHLLSTNVLEEEVSKSLPTVTTTHHTVAAVVPMDLSSQAVIPPNQLHHMKELLPTVLVHMALRSIHHLVFDKTVSA